MQYKIIDESPWQILSNAMTIGPSSTGYQLQVAADGRNYTTLFTVGAGITRQITNLSSGSYFRMKGNVGEVTVNWVRSCGGGSGSGGNAGELEPVTEFPVGVPEGTVVALSSGDTVGVFQFDGTEWVSVGGDLSDYYTKAETDAQITAATTPIEEHIGDVERVTASALTELHQNILDLSGATNNYYTKNETDTQIADAIASIPQPDLSNYYTKDQIAVKEEVVSRALNELNTSKVSSTSVSTIWRGTQAEYDAITTPDASTLYIIINN